MLLWTAALLHSLLQPVGSSGFQDPHQNLLNSGGSGVRDALGTQMAAPFAAVVRRLVEIPGINIIAACAILAEIGTDMGRFPTAGHLVSWAKFAPGIKESAGKKKGKGTTGHGNRYLARVLGNAAASAGRTYAGTGDTAIPISTVTNKPGRPIHFRGRVSTIAVNPDGKTAYVQVDPRRAGPPPCSSRSARPPTRPASQSPSAGLFMESRS